MHSALRCSRALAAALVLALGYAATAWGIDLVRLIKTFRPVPDSTEIKIGQGIAANLLGAAPPVADPALQAYVNKIGGWVALQSDRPELPWRFAVLDTDSVNAFAVPGGYVFLTRGLLLLMRDESELAGVLAHEISHVVERHALKTMRKGELAALGGEVLANLAAKEGAEDMQKVINVGTDVYNRGLDKKDEFAADVEGAVLAARAGYDPYGLLAVLQTLSSINPQDDAVALMFKTHPAAEQRSEELLPTLEALEAHAGQPNNAERFAATMRAHVAHYTPTARSATGAAPRPEDPQQEKAKALAPFMKR